MSTLSFHRCLSDGHITSICRFEQRHNTGHVTRHSVAEQRVFFVDGRRHMILELFAFQRIVSASNTADLHHIFVSNLDWPIYKSFVSSSM